MVIGEVLFYTKGAPSITIFTDHSVLCLLHKKELLKVPNQRLINMLEKISGYNFTITYLPESQNKLT